MSDSRNTAVWIFALDAKDARPALDWVAALPGGQMPQRLVSRFDALGAALAQAKPATIVVGPMACAQRDELRAAMRRTDATVGWVLLDPAAAMRGGSDGGTQGEDSPREISSWLDRVAHDLRGDVGLVGPVLDAVAATAGQEGRGPASGLLVLARRGMVRVLRHAELLSEVGAHLADAEGHGAKGGGSTDLVALVKAASERAEQVVGFGQITLKLDGIGPEGVQVIGAPDRWALLLRELIVLGLRHCRTGVTIRLAQSPGQSADGRSVELRVTSDGTAVPTAPWAPKSVAPAGEGASDRAVGRWLVGTLAETLGYVLDAGIDEKSAAYFVVRPG